MIVHDDFIIASSTKSGTHSCMALANATPGMKYIRTNHMMVVPEEHAHKDRLYLVRNPYDRLLSIYHHIYRKYTEWGHRYIKYMDFNQFLDWFLDQRQELSPVLETTDSYGAPGVWVRTAFENWSELILDDHLDMSYEARCYWFRLEDDEFFDWVIERYKLSTRRSEMPRTNTADNFLERESRSRGWDGVDPDLKRRVDREWAKQDLVFFGYPNWAESAV